ncbi:MAG: 30S ribosomal protein S2, partial [Nitrososphaerota archaeon]
MSSANQEENAKDSLDEIKNQTYEDSDSQAYTETGEEDIENDNLEKMILSTGIRVGTPVKTKFMSPFIVRANPEGLYILDISKTLTRIDVAAKFIGRSD